jgi:hypothetical protein
MSIEVPPRHIAGSLQNRQARPLNGIEVRDSVKKHVLAVGTRLLNDQGLKSDHVIELVDKVSEEIDQALSRETRLQKMNVTYPKVGWSIKIRLEETESMRWLSGEVELDLERNVRIPIRFGPSGGGIVVGSLEEEKLSTPVPDKTRQEFGLPVEAEYIKPDGTTGKVDINDLKPTERRAARTVDVGSARVQGEEVSQGVPVVLPSELPEISLDDLVATPPEVPKDIPAKPLPPKGSMTQVTRPNVKFKGGK